MGGSTGPFLPSYMDTGQLEYRQIILSLVSAPQKTEQSSALCDSNQPLAWASSLLPPQLGRRSCGLILR